MSWVKCIGSKVLLTRLPIFLAKLVFGISKTPLWQISIIFARQLMVRVPRSFSFLFCFMFLTFFVYIRLWLTLCGELLFTSQLSSKTRIFWPTGPPSAYQRLNWNHNKNMCVFKWSFVKEIFLNPRRYLIFYLWKDKTQVRIEKNLI